jgi:magnesium transporter
VQTLQQQKNYRYFGTLRRLLRRNAVPNIKKIINRIHPVDLAQVFTYFPSSDQTLLLSYIDNSEKQSDILKELNISMAKEIVEELGTEKSVKIICEMPPDDQADLLAALDEELASEILAAMPQEDSDDVQDLMRYDEHSAGGIMNSDVLAIHMDSTVEEATNKIQESQDVDLVFYIYVVDDYGSLMGVLSLRHLVVSKPGTIIKDVMNPNVVSVRPEEDQEDVARFVTKYDFLAIPVVDETNCLIGAVSVDDVIDVISDEATEDILRMAGAGTGDGSSMTVSPFKHVLSRAPWLFAALIGGIIASLVIENYEHVLTKFLPVAAFIPVIIGMAGNVGTQSLAVVVRGLATNQIKISNAWKVIGNEILVGLMLGLVYGAILGAFGLMQFHGAPIPALNLAIAIGSATACAMILAAMVASSIPLMFAKINIDPAVATGPFVTTAIDILGVFIYFTVVELVL